MSKQLLRKKIIEYLSKLPKDERGTIEKKLHDQIIEQPFWKDAHTIGITVSQNIEWDTYNIIETAWKQGKKVAVPKCDPKLKQLHFYVITSFDQLEIAHFNIKEPIPSKTEEIHYDEMDLLVVPGLVFDQRGYRVGFGGGYYDRFLTKYNKETVSIISSEQLTEKIPTEAFDLPVRNIITEKEVIKTVGGE